MTANTPTGPKWTRGTLDYSNNTYAVRNGLMFDYYEISCRSAKDGDVYTQIYLSPNTMEAGVAMFGKKMYDVSQQDLVRRRIDVRKVRPASDNTNLTSDKPAKKSTTSRVVEITDQSRSSDISGDEISKAANLAWENQVNSLLQTLHSEEGEEWEVTDSAQSGSNNESGTVQDLL